MRSEYDIKNLNPRKNPYSEKLKKQITINLNIEIVDYFKEQSNISGIPYQTLINMYLDDCVKKHRQIKIDWQ